MCLLLVQFNNIYKKELKVIEAMKHISLELTKMNKELILNKDMEFNGITSSNSAIFVSEKGIFILNLIPYLYNNSSLEITNNSYIITKDDSSKLNFNVTFNNNEDVNFKYINKILPKRIPIHHIYVICNNNMFIKNESDKLFTKYSNVQHTIEKIITDVNLNQSEQECILGVLKKNINNSSVEHFINKKYKLLSLIQSLDNSIDEYLYIENVLKQYKEIFEFNQNINICYNNDINKYLLTKK